MFSPGSSSSQKRKRADGSGPLSMSSSGALNSLSHIADSVDNDDLRLVLRPKGKIPQCDASSGRIYRNGDFLSLSRDRKSFLLHRDVLHCLHPSKSVFDSIDTSDSSFKNFRHEICYDVDEQGDRTIIGCSRGGEVFFASPGGVYAQSQLECCIDKSDEVTAICAINLESALAIVAGTSRGEMYVVACPVGSTHLFAVGPLERPHQPLLQGLMESGVKMLGFGLSGLGFGSSATPATVAGNDAARSLYGSESYQQVIKLMTIASSADEGEDSSDADGHLLCVSPSTISLWTTSSSINEGGSFSTNNETQWGQSLAEYDIVGILCQDIQNQRHGKVTSERDKPLKNRQFVIVDTLLYQYSKNIFPAVATLAILSVAPSPSSTDWELWLHLVEVPVAAAGEGSVKVRLRRRVAFLKKPSSKQLHPELYRRERSKQADSLFITWFNGTGLGNSSTSDHFSLHAVEIIDVDEFCTEEETSDDSETYVQYLDILDTDTGDAKQSCMVGGLGTGFPLATSDTTQRPFVTINVVASLNHTAYSSGRNRATQAVPSSVLPIYELTLIWRDGSLFSCLPPRASCRELYTTCKVDVIASEQAKPEEIIEQYVNGGEIMSENQCFTALVKATSGMRSASANGILLSELGASAILKGALVVSTKILKLKKITSSSHTADSAGSLSHRLLLEKKIKHDKLFPLMRSVLDNCSATDLNLRELSWHRSLLLGSLALSNNMADVIKYGGAPAGVSSSGLLRSQSRDKKRSVSTSSKDVNDESFESVVWRGLGKVVLSDQSDTPTADAFFADPFLLPAGLYRIAKEIESRHSVPRGNSNHSLLEVTCDFLSMLLSVIQSPKLSDLSISGQVTDGSAHKRGTSSRSSKNVTEEVTISAIEKDECCLALASDENLRSAAYIGLLVLEDCVSVYFADDFGSVVRDDVQALLDTKRLYKLVHIILFGYENSLQRRVNSATSPPAKKGTFGSSITNREKILNDCHKLKKCGANVFFESKKLQEAYTLSSRFAYFEGMCQAAFGDETDVGSDSISTMKKLRADLESILRDTRTGNDVVGYVESPHLKESKLTLFLLTWLERKFRFSSLLEVGECMHPTCMTSFLASRPYLKWIYSLKKKDFLSASINSFGYTQFDYTKSADSGFSHLLPKDSVKAVKILQDLPLAADCVKGPHVVSSRCAKSLLSVSKLCAWIDHVECDDHSKQATSSAEIVDSSTLLDMNKKSLLTIRAQEFLSSHTGQDPSSVSYTRSPPDILVKSLLDVVEDSGATIDVDSNLRLRILSVALGLLNLNMDCYLNETDKQSSDLWFSLVEKLWCTSVASSSATDIWLQLTAYDHKNDVVQHENLLRTTDLYHLMHEVAQDSSVALFRDTIENPARVKKIVQHLIEKVPGESDKKDLLTFFVLKCVELALSDV